MKADHRDQHPRPHRATVALNWIDGEWTDADEHRESFDPATGRRIGSYAHASRHDVERAIQAARRAFCGTPWKDDRQLRSRVLNAMADRFEARRDDLIELLALDNGKVKDEAAFEVDMVTSKVRYAAALPLTGYGRAMEVLPGRISMVLRQPMGVAGVIEPPPLDRTPQTSHGWRRICPCQT